MKRFVLVCLSLSPALVLSAFADVYEVSAEGDLQAKERAADVFPEITPSAAFTSSPAIEIPDRWLTEFAAAAEKYDLSLSLLAAVAWQESRFRADALSPRGAIGLMQLMPGTALELGVDPHSPEDNIFGGAAYLRQLLDQFDGRVDLALAAYNAGPTRVERLQATPNIPETIAYVSSLMGKLADTSDASSVATSSP